MSHVTSHRSALSHRLAFLGGALLALGGAGCGAPETDAASAPLIASDSGDEALEGAAGAYAAAHGVSTQEALRRLRLQEKIGEAPALQSAEASPRFAGAWIEHRPEFRLVVRLAGKEEVPAGLRLAAERAPAKMEFVTGAAASLSELVDAIAAAGPDLRTALPGLAATDIDVKTGEILLQLQPGAKADGLASVRALRGRPVRVEALAAPAEDMVVRGGANLSSCTVGWSVRNTGGTRGFVTAGHCGNSQTYSDFSGGSTSTTFQSEIRDADQDVQWATTPQTENPEFYANSTTTFRTVSGQVSRTSQVVGGSVCHRGKTTGYSCGSIASKNYQPTWSNACPGTTCSAVSIRVTGSGLKCAGGDSGGPWFLGNSAYGTLKGGSSSGTGAGQCAFSVYMAINYITGLGVSLLM